jgi:hypothetical protein
MGFSLYLRYILTPISAMTWANLNHTLCAVDNDPWRAYFGMHKFFYFWSEFYLGLTSVVTQYFVSLLAFMFCQWRQFTVHQGPAIKLRQFITGLILVVGEGYLGTFIVVSLLKEAEKFGYTHNAHQ